MSAPASRAPLSRASALPDAPSAALLALAYVASTLTVSAVAGTHFQASLGAAQLFARAFADASTQRLSHAGGAALAVSVALNACTLLVAFTLVARRVGFVRTRLALWMMIAVPFALAYTLIADVEPACLPLDIAVGFRTIVLFTLAHARGPRLLIAATTTLLLGAWVAVIVLTTTSPPTACGSSPSVSMELSIAVATLAVLAVPRVRLRRTVLHTQPAPASDNEGAVLLSGGARPPSPPLGSFEIGDDGATADEDELP